MDSTARVRTLSAVKRQRSPTYQRAKPVTPATRNTRRHVITPLEPQRRCAHGPLWLKTHSAVGRGTRPRS